MGIWRVVLFDAMAANREPVLRGALHTSWDILPVPYRSDLELAQRYLADAQAFIGNEFPHELSRCAQRLRLIQCIGAGVDLFDLAAIPPGCALCNVYEHEIPIAEYIVMCMLMFATQVTAASAEMRQGDWRRSGRQEGEFHDELLGKTLGLIGFGHIGQAVASRARAFGMRVVAIRQHASPHPALDWCGGMDDLPELLPQSDYVAVVCPLTPRTRGLLGASQLRLLKPGAVLINPARAAIIDESALFRALQERWFAGAALDVWYQDPTKGGTRVHGSALPFHELPNVLVTPHFSGWTRPMIERRYQKIAANLDHLARGEPLDGIVYRAPAAK